MAPIEIPHLSDLFENRAPAPHSVSMKRRDQGRLGHVVAAFCVILAQGGCVAGPVGNPHPPEPSRSLEIRSYLGRWYEFARYDSSFEHGCEGVTADYRLKSDGDISVLNTCHKGDPDGPVSIAKGRAKRTGDALGAKLKVSFFGPFYGDYWVLDHADDYSWSIVGEPSGRFLWILTRKSTPSAETQSRLLERAKALGYNLSRLHVTQQH